MGPLGADQGAHESPPCGSTLDPHELVRTESFPIVDVGYGSFVVHRHLTEVANALAEDRDVSTLLHPTFELVSYGYEAAQVDALFRNLREALGRFDAVASPAIAGEPSASPPVEASPLRTPPSRPNAPEVTGPPTERIGATRFPVARGPGYAPADVDAWLAQVAERRRSGPTLSRLSPTFRVVARNGYDTAAVDGFVERLFWSSVADRCRP